MGEKLTVRFSEKLGGEGFVLEMFDLKRFMKLRNGFVFLAGNANLRFSPRRLTTNDLEERMDELEKRVHELFKK